MTNGDATRTIDLRCGGTVTLSVRANLFEMAPEDRTFVFSLIDRLAEYQAEVDDEEAPAA
jgi:hypothetical protein